MNRDTDNGKRLPNSVLIGRWDQNTVNDTIGRRPIREMSADEYLQAIRAVETAFGIKPPKPVRPEAPKSSKLGRPFRNWTPEQLALFGTMPDAELAKRLGCAVNTVFHLRRKLRIPSFQEARQKRRRKEKTQ